MFIKDFEDRIKKHEGLSLRVYEDTKSIPTIGYGHNLTLGISKEIAELLFQLDLKQAYEDYIFRFPSEYKQHLMYDNVRQSVIIELIFNMGLHSLLTFKKMLFALKEGDFREAKLQLLDSKYYKDVRERCETLANLLERGDK